MTFICFPHDLLDFSRPFSFKKKCFLNPQITCAVPLNTTANIPQEQTVVSLTFCHPSKVSPHHAPSPNRREGCSGKGWESPPLWKSSAFTFTAHTTGGGWYFFFFRSGTTDFLNRCSTLLYLKIRRQITGLPRVLTTRGPLVNIVCEIMGCERSGFWFLITFSRSIRGVFEGGFWEECGVWRGSNLWVQGP